MTHIITPHFDLPFRFGTSSEGAVTVEQDSADDVFNCVEASILYIKGQRLDTPTFGITEPVFDSQPISTDRIISEVLEHEPRASVLAEQRHSELVEQLIAKVLLRVGLKEEEE